MYRTLLEGVWRSDIGSMAEVRNVPHLACKVSVQMFNTYFIIRRGPVLLYSHLASKVRYISFQRNLQLKIHLSSYFSSGFPNFPSGFSDFPSGFPDFLRQIASDPRAQVA